MNHSQAPPNQKMVIELDTITTSIPHRWEFKMSFSIDYMAPPKDPLGIPSFILQTCYALHKTFCIAGAAVILVQFLAGLAIVLGYVVLSVNKNAPILRSTVSAKNTSYKQQRLLLLKWPIAQK